MLTSTPTRRRFLATTAASTALVAMPHVRGSYAAGRLTIGLWDHWVPSANAASTALIQEWAAQEKVEVQIDYITTQGNKLLLTEQAEAQAKTGHDILTFRCWGPADHARLLEPVDDVMGPLIKQNGAVNATATYLGKSEGHWAAVPATRGSNIKGPCSRIDLLKKHAGIDVQAMYPAGGQPRADNWTLDTFLEAARACHKAGFAFGIGLGTTTDSVDSAGAIFDSFGAVLVDAKGNVTVRSDPVRQALDYYVRLARFFPPDAPVDSLRARRGSGCLVESVPADDPPADADLTCARSLRPRSRPRRESSPASDLGRGGAAEGDALPLPEPVRPPESVDRRRAGAAEDRGADLRAGHHDQDDRAPHAGRADGEDSRLGRERGRRLLAHVRSASAGGS